MESHRMNGVADLGEHWLTKALKWLIQKVGPGYLVQSGLLLVLFWCLVNGLAAASRRLEPALLAQPVLAGALLAGLLARTRLAGGWVVMLVAALGVGVVGWRVENLGILAMNHIRLLNDLSLVQATTGYTLGSRVGESQFQQAWQEIFRSLAELKISLEILGVRAAAWLSQIQQQEAGFDPALSSLVWGMIFWCLGAWTSWALWRRQQPFLAVLPAGVLLATSLAYTGASAYFLLGVLGTALLLSAWDGISHRLDSWIARQIDYAEELRLEVAITAGLLTAFLLFMSGISSLFSVEKFEAFLERAIPGDNRIVQPVGESLGLAQRTAEPLPTERRAKTGLSLTGLPRVHLIGSGAELSEESVMYISTGDLPPMPVQMSGSLQVPRYYWRTLTYDVYTGDGWTASEHQQMGYIPGEAVHAGYYLFPPEGWKTILHPNTRLPGMRLVRFRVEEAADLNGLAYASGDLIGMDVRYRVLWRLPPDPAAGQEGDAFALLKLAREKKYTVYSLLTRPDETLLRSAQDQYPSWVEQRYLSLSEALPQQVRDLAQDLVAGQPTRFDQARAIENYLRQIPYTLDLPAPPADRDIVDYFLFDLRQGYCDYYASAMVVLARAAGLPARLVVGYASGSYDLMEAVYRVSEADGHSWPEIYFSGIGWVEFEPTAARPQIERLPGANQVMENLPALTNPGLSEQPLETWNRYLRIGLGAFLASAIVGFAWLSWSISESWRIRRGQPGRLIVLLFRRVYRSGKRLGAQARRGDTPLEYGKRLGSRLDQAAGKSWLNKFFSLARLEIDLVVKLYNAVVYGPHPVKREDGQSALDAWQRLRWRLWLSRFKSR
jgi:transglutaminase-like putative cysteine protease